MAVTGSKKQQTEYITIAILVLAAFFIGINRFKKKDVKDDILSREQFMERWKEVEIIEKAAPVEEKGVSYTLDDKGKNPFKNPFEDIEPKEVVIGDVDLPAMNIQGMVWNSLRPQVIINNKVYDVDETIAIGGGEHKVKIKDIKKDGVYLLYKRREFIVKPK